MTDKNRWEELDPLKDPGDVSKKRKPVSFSRWFKGIERTIRKRLGLSAVDVKDGLPFVNAAGDVVFGENVFDGCCELKDVEIVFHDEGTLEVVRCPLCGGMFVHTPECGLLREAKRTIAEHAIEDDEQE